MHEKSKKARLSHVTEFGDATYAPSGTARTSMNMIDKLSNPGIVMKLRYRSRALLELEGVVQGSSRQLFATVPPRVADSVSLHAQIPMHPSLKFPTPTTRSDL